jgi:pyruvate/2-oxoglutarate dehydrogenase complex dihydrolipoamide dehydrogenase (E3) component
VLLNTRVTPEWADSFQPDVLVCAVGASHIVPPIPGIDHPKVKFLPSLKEEKDSFGHRVVVLGGGLVGSETAIHLHQLGHEVTIVEMGDDFARDATLWHKQAIKQQFRKGVELLLNTRAVAITEEGVQVEDQNGTRRVVPADSVFCAVGLRSNAQVRESLRFVVPDFITVGDCEQPAQVFEAVSRAYYRAQAL